MANLVKAKSLKKEIESLGGNLIAVSKRFSCVDIKEVYSAGVKDFGENYLTEALEKIKFLEEIDGLRWHFIGRVQSGNIGRMVNKFYMIHSIYKIQHLKKINDKSNYKQKVLLQLLHEGDTREFGLSETDLFNFLSKAKEFANIDLAGIMFMPPPSFEGDELKQAFEWAAEVFAEAGKALSSTDNSWTSLSMGMSADYKNALEAGSTHVRIGTAIFGQRRDLKS